MWMCRDMDADPKTFVSFFFRSCFYKSPVVKICNLCH